MKKTISIIIAIMLVLSTSVILASADDGAKIRVTISDDKGKLVVAAEEITVTDIDGDEAITINDALYAAHEKFYDGGAAAGYATEDTQWGLSLVKLWGTANGGSFGYMVNNVAAWSMTDPVQEGDYVAAYVFTEPVKLLDKYSYFDKLEEDVKAGEITLTLKKNDFDKDWNPITLPVKGATITVDGSPIDAVTDEEGKVTFTLDINGKHLISATASDQVISPPVFIANVTGGKDPVPETQPETVAPTVAPTGSATPDSTPTGSNPNAIQTGSNMMLAFAALAVMALAAAVFAFTKKKHEE